MLAAFQLVAQQVYGQRQQYIQAFFANPRTVAGVTGIAVTVIFAGGERLLKFLGFNRSNPTLDALKHSFEEFKGMDMSDSDKVAETIFKIREKFRQLENNQSASLATQIGIITGYNVIKEKSKAVVQTLRAENFGKELTEAPEFDPSNPASVVVFFNDWFNSVPALHRDLKQVKDEKKAAGEKADLATKQKDQEIKDLRHKYEFNMDQCRQNLTLSQTKQLLLMNNLTNVQNDYNKCNAEKTQSDADLAACKKKKGCWVF